MILKCNDAQIIKMATLAVNASKPMGMGILHYVPGDYTESKVIEVANLDLVCNKINGTRINIDYFGGRMVKFYARYTPEGWNVDDEIQIDYQSWKSKYPSYQALLDAVIELENM